MLSTLSVYAGANPVNISEFSTLKESHSRLKSNFPVIYMQAGSIGGDCDCIEYRELYVQSSSLVCFINALCMSRFLVDGGRYYSTSGTVQCTQHNFRGQEQTAGGRRIHWIHKLSFC